MIVCDRCDKRPNNSMTVIIRHTIIESDKYRVNKDLCNYCLEELEKVIKGFCEPLPKMVQKGQ